MITQTLTCEQLEDRLAALHQASLEMVQDISLDSLLEKIAMLACEQVQARYGALVVLNAKGAQEAFIPVGMSKAEIRRLSRLPRGMGSVGSLLETGESIRIPDISAGAAGSVLPEKHPEMKAFLGVPIRRGANLLGRLFVTNRQDGGEFSADDQKVLETVAAYAAVAIHNARQYRALMERDRLLSRRNENLGLLNDLAVTLASSSDIDQILDRALLQVMEYLRLEAGEIFLCPEGDKTLKMVLHRSQLVPALWLTDQFPLGKGMVGQTARTGVPRLMTVTSSDGHELHPSVNENCFRQVACFPLPGRNAVLGVLCIGSCQARPLDDLEMQFLSAISAWIGSAIENVRLNISGRRLVVLEERERIGMDLHDGIIQSIYAVGLTLEHARLLLNSEPKQAQRRIQQAIGDLNSTIRDIRAYILDLRPRQLHDEDLMAGLQRLVTEFRANSLVETHLKGPVDGQPVIPPGKSVALFHICQESLANIAKHAHAKQVKVFLWATSERALLEISDDGRGFDPQKVKMTLGHGLSNMQTRARNVGGDVELTSEPGAGTTILSWVPLTDGE